MKYIMFEIELDQKTKWKIPIIFPDQLVHSEIARTINQALRRQYGDLPMKVVSAGMIEIDALSVSGESETLKLKHNPMDLHTIIHYNYLHGL